MESLFKVIVENAPPTIRIFVAFLLAGGMLGFLFYKAWTRHHETMTKHEDETVTERLLAIQEANAARYNQLTKELEDEKKERKEQEKECARKLKEMEGKSKEMEDNNRIMTGAYQVIEAKFKAVLYLLAHQRSISIPEAEELIAGILEKGEVI